MLSFLLKFIGEQDFEQFSVKEITCCHDNPIFDNIFSFIYVFLLNNDFFKTSVNS